MKCDRCPREDDETTRPRLRAVPNSACDPRHTHDPVPPPFATEVLILCDNCALMDKHDSVPLDEVGDVLSS